MIWRGNAKNSAKACLFYLAFFSVVASCPNLSTIKFGCKDNANNAEYKIIHALFILYP